jgi:AraC family transcriptional regulator
MSNALRIFQGEFGRVALLDMDKSLVPHAHSQCHVLIKASGADTYFCVREGRHLLSDRSAVLINTWEPHYYAHQPNAPRTVILALYIEPAWLAALHSPLRSSARPNFFPQPCVEISPRVRMLADDLIADMLSLGQSPRARVESLLFDLMIAVIEPYSDWRSMAQVITPCSLQSPDARINRAISYIKSNLGEPLEMEQLAREVHLSRAHFFARFRQCTQMTPHIFINMVRMDAACQRLADGRQGTTLAELSRDLGFHEQGHFTRFVRGHLGVTPSEYRRVVDVYDGAHAGSSAVGSAPIIG